MGIKGTDEFGIVTNDLEGAELVAKNITKETLVFAWSHNKSDCYIFSISKGPNVIGVLPFSGQPHGRYWVSCYNLGAGHFSSRCGFPGDWDELNLDSSAKVQWTKFWNMIMDKVK